MAPISFKSPNYKKIARLERQVESLQIQNLLLMNGALAVEPFILTNTRVLAQETFALPLTFSWPTGALWAVIVGRGSTTLNYTRPANTVLTGYRASAACEGPATINTFSLDSVVIPGDTTLGANLTTSLAFDQVALDSSVVAVDVNVSFQLIGALTDIGTKNIETTISGHVIYFATTPPSVI